MTDEAMLRRAVTKVAEVEIVFYRFDVSLHTEKGKYLNLVRKLRDREYRRFNCYSNGTKEIKCLHDRKKVKLYLDWISDSHQFNSDAGRVHDWKEVIYPNDDIKEGYYLKLTEKVKRLRRIEDFKQSIPI